MGESSKVTAGERIARFTGIAPRLAVVNFVCFLAFLPVFSWFYLLVNTYIHASFDTGVVDLLPGIGYFAGLLLRLPPLVFYALLILSALLLGPLLLGLHAVTGGIVTGRHVWVSDFFSEALRNARQGVILGLFCVVAGQLTLWNIFGGLHSDTAWLAFLLSVSRWISVLLFLLFWLTVPFVCQIAVSLEQPLWAVVKNGMILSRVYLGRGLLALLGIGLTWWVTTVSFPGLSLLSLPLLSIGFTAFVQTAVSRPIVDRYLLEPARRWQNDNSK